MKNKNILIIIILSIVILFCGITILNKKVPSEKNENSKENLEVASTQSNDATEKEDSIDGKAIGILEDNKVLILKSYIDSKKVIRNVEKQENSIRVWNKVFIYDMNSKKSEEIDGVVFDNNYSISPNGKYILYKPNENGSVSILNTETHKIKNLNVGQNKNLVNTFWLDEENFIIPVNDKLIKKVNVGSLQTKDFYNKSKSRIVLAGIVEDELYYYEKSTSTKEEYLSNIVFKSINIKTKKEKKLLTYNDMETVPRFECYDKGFIVVYDCRSSKGYNNKVIELYNKEGELIKSYDTYDVEYSSIRSDIKYVISNDGKNIYYESPNGLMCFNTENSSSKTLMNVQSGMIDNIYYNNKKNILIISICGKYRSENISYILSNPNKLKTISYNASSDEQNKVEQCRIALEEKVNKGKYNYEFMRISNVDGQYYAVFFTERNPIDVYINLETKEVKKFNIYIDTIAVDMPLGMAYELQSEVK